MSGFIPKEGLGLLAEAFFNKDTTDLGTDFDLGLFTNASVDADTVLADITEPTGDGYARITLTDADWTFTALTGVVENLQKTFTAGASGFTDPQGYFIVSKGASPKLAAIEVGVGAPYDMSGDGYTLKVTPKVTLSSPVV